MESTIIHTRFYHYRMVSSHLRHWYLILLLLLLMGIGVLPFVQYQRTVKAAGMIRPVSERLNIRPAVSGVLEGLLPSEGQLVRKGEIIFRIRNTMQNEKKRSLNTRLNRLGAEIRDIRILCRGPSAHTRLSEIKTARFQQEWREMMSRREELDNEINRLQEALRFEDLLFRDGITSLNELNRKRWELNQQKQVRTTFLARQYSQWQQELDQAIQRMDELELELRSAESEAQLYEVRAPVSGSLEQIADKQSGMQVAMNESLCMISPDTLMVAEVMISNRDIARIRKGQHAVVYPEAFTQLRENSLPGRVYAIADDYTTVGEQPVYTLRISLDFLRTVAVEKKQPSLKKGMVIQARIVTGKQSLWNLLTEKARLIKKV